MNDSIDVYDTSDNGEASQINYEKPSIAALSAKDSVGNPLKIGCSSGCSNDGCPEC